MAVLVRTLMLLAAVPLLLPTGFCVCKVGERVGPSSVQSADPPVAKKKSCCSLCASAATETPPAPPSQKLPPTDDHLPGCPASPGSDGLKWVEPTSQLAAVLALPTVFTPLVAEASPVATTVPFTSHRPSNPPLYLSHCALVL